MYRRSAVEAAGGYKDFFLLEDYFLWVRMLLKSSKGYNIQEPVLWMRAGSDLYKRRGGWEYVSSEKKLFSYMLNKGFINKKEYYQAVTSRTVGAMVPNWMRSMYGIRSIFHHLKYMAEKVLSNHLPRISMDG